MHGHFVTGFNPSRGIAIIQTTPKMSKTIVRLSFNPSRGIAIIQTAACGCAVATCDRFNPSRGIAIIQTACWRGCWCWPGCFNPSRGIAIIQTVFSNSRRRTQREFQSLTRDSNHSNMPEARAFQLEPEFQSLTRDSNHSNLKFSSSSHQFWSSFNPSRGIAIIQTQGHL